MGARYAVTLTPEVRTVLESSTFGRTWVILPEGLDRKLYEKVMKVITAAGGKWDKRAKAHTFAGGIDVREVLGMVLETGSIVDTRKALQQFFTSQELAIQLCEGVMVGDTVLEPSAGGGAIAAAAAVRGGIVTCVEIDAKLAEALAKWGFQTFAEDFLGTTNKTFARQFDYVLMNPPFAEGRDLAHVRHAFQFLKAGGTLKAIMPSGVLFREDQAHKQFRAFVQAYGGTIVSLPAGSFSEAGTQVNTVLVTVRKPVVS